MTLDREFAGMIGQIGDRTVEPGLGGNIDEQIVDRRGTDGGEHGRTVVGGEREVTHG